MTSGTLLNVKSKTNHEAQITYNQNMNEVQFRELLGNFFIQSGQALDLTRHNGGFSIPLHGLFLMVYQKLGGFQRVTESSQWCFVATKLGLPGTTEAGRRLSSIYEIVLLPFERHLVAKIGSIPSSSVPYKIQNTTLSNNNSTIMIPSKFSQKLTQKSLSWALDKPDIHGVIKLLKCKSSTTFCFAMASLERLFSGMATPVQSQYTIDCLLDTLCDVFADSSKVSAEYVEIENFYSYANEGSITASVVNISRCLSSRREYAPYLGIHPQFLERILLPSLVLAKSADAWMIFSNIASSCRIRSEKSLGLILQAAIAGLKIAKEKLASHSYILSSSLWADLSSTEVIKRSIISFIQVSSQFWKTCPAECFLILETVNTIVVNGDPKSILEQYGTVPTDRDIYHTLVALLETIDQLVTQFSIVLLKLSHLISVLVTDTSFQASTDYSKWLTMVIHNVNFGFPDGGYIELSLLSMIHLLRRLDSEDSELPKWAEKLIISVTELISALRILWLNSPLSPQQNSSTATAPKAGSPLLTQPITANNSQPYLIFLKLFKLLDSLLNHIPTDALLATTESVVSKALEWPVSDSHPSKDLIWNDLIKSVTDKLLGHLVI